MFDVLYDIKCLVEQSRYMLNMYQIPNENVDSKVGSKVVSWLKSLSELLWTYPKKV